MAKRPTSLYSLLFPQVLPVASALLGTNKPRDLGIELSTESALAGLQSLNMPFSVDELENIYNNPDLYTRVNTSIG